MEAFVKLSACCEYGWGTEKDLIQAIAWLTRAAEQGDDKSQYELGLRYYEGKDVEQDYAKAIYWYTRAAEQGHIYAQCNLGYVTPKGWVWSRTMAKQQNGLPLLPNITNM